MELNTIVCAEALQWMSGLPDQSVDMILCDLPYGTTACSWDEIIPFAPMWEQFRRVTKPRAAIVLTASQPFTSKLVMSNLPMFRCEWIWEKEAGTGYLNANRQPMKNHESVLVFAVGAYNYYPQKRKGKPYSATSGAVGDFVRDKTVGGYLTINSGDRYPLSVVRVNSESGHHPTQKPVALFEYLIRTYTQPNEIVLDCCVGSGTTCIAARNTGRHFLACDSDAGYVEVARRRLSQPWQPQLMG